MFHL
jgi:hypothetical protein